MIETKRLVLETWKEEDWTSLEPIATDPEVMHYITGGPPWSEERIRDFVDRQIRLYAERGFCRWKLRQKDSAEMAGFCGVGFWRDHPHPEIGWWLARKHWGQGLAMEAARAALTDAFERVRLERIVSVAMAGNLRSIRIMQKLGLTLECEFENEGFQMVRYAIARPGNS